MWPRRGQERRREGRIARLGAGSSAATTSPYGVRCYLPLLALLPGTVATYMSCKLWACRDDWLAPPASAAGPAGGGWGPELADALMQKSFTMSSAFRSRMELTFSLCEPALPHATALFERAPFAAKLAAVTGLFLAFIAD